MLLLSQLKTKNYGKEKRWKKTEQEANGRNVTESVPAESEWNILVQTNIKNSKTFLSGVDISVSMRYNGVM